MSTKHYVTGMDAPGEDDGEDPLWEGHDGYPVDINPLGSGCITYWLVDSEGDTWAACDTHGTLRMWDLEDSRVLDVRAATMDECSRHWSRHYNPPTWTTRPWTRSPTPGHVLTSQPTEAE